MGLKDFLRQIGGGIRKGSQFLMQNAGTGMEYLKQIPAVGELMTDTKGVQNLIKKAANAYRAKKRGDIAELPNIEDLVGAIRSGATTVKKIKDGGYSPAAAM